MCIRDRFSGDVSIAGTITYEDVTHVDSQGIGTFRQGINVVGHSEIDALRVSGVSTFQNNVDFPDNVKIYLGTGDDFEIYHDGSNNQSIIKESGASVLKILGSDLRLSNTGNTADYLQANDGGAVKLFFNGGAAKFETTGVGATVTGEMHATTFHGDGSQLTGVAAAGSGGGALDITSCLFI